MSSKFFDEIKCAKKEEEVAFVYNKEISFYFLNDNISFLEHPYGCDGSFIKGMLRLLVEYKHDVELKNTVSRAKVLVQVLYYLKRFELNGERLPNVIMVGDINEVFVIHVNFLDKYLDEDIDWNIAPSSAHESNLDLVNKIAHDDNINPYVIQCPKCKHPMLPNVSSMETKMNLDFYNNSIINLASSDAWLILYPSAAESSMLDMMKSALSLNKNVENIYICDKDINTKENYKNTFNQINEKVNVNIEINVMEEFLKSV